VPAVKAVKTKPPEPDVPRPTRDPLPRVEVKITKAYFFTGDLDEFAHTFVYDLSPSQAEAYRDAVNRGVEDKRRAVTNVGPPATVGHTMPKTKTEHDAVHYQERLARDRDFVIGELLKVHPQLSACQITRRADDIIAQQIVDDLSPQRAAEFLEAVRRYVGLKRQALAGGGPALGLH
jgi:hypothetical protein